MQINKAGNNETTTRINNLICIIFGNAHGNIHDYTIVYKHIRVCVDIVGWVNYMPIFD